MKWLRYIIVFTVLLGLLSPFTVGADLDGRKKINIILPGERQVFHTRARTVEDFVHNNRHTFPPGSIKQIHPSQHAKIREGMHLFMLFENDSSRKHQTVNYETKIIPTRAIPKNRKLMIRGGKKGLKVGGKLRREPVSRLVLKGQTEYKTRQLKGVKENKSMRILATGYSPHRLDTYPYNDGYSALGLPAGYGVVAVDPDVIPLGTHLYIEGYGYAIAADVGGSIEGRRIDLGFHRRSNALQFGRRWVTVHILG